MTQFTGRFSFAAVFAAIWLVFGATLREPIGHLDDQGNILTNPQTQELDRESLQTIWTAPFRMLYIPITYTAWAVEAAIGRAVAGDLRPDARVFYAANLLVHGLNTILVLCLLYQLFSFTPAALIGALLYGLHPLQVEPVAWITGAKDLLSAMFLLLALNLSIVGPGRGTWPPWARAGITTILFCAAMLAKPSVVVAPIALVALRRHHLGMGWLRSTTVPLLWGALALPIVLLTQHLQGQELMPIPVPALSDRPVIALDAITFYLQKVLWPVGLCLDYGHTPARVLARWSGVASLFCAAVLGGLGLWTYQAGSRVAKIALMTGLAFLLPVLGFAPFAFQAVSTVADRYATLSLIGVAIGTAAIVHHFWLRSVVRHAAVVVVLALGIRSMNQVQVWRTPQSLYEWTLHVNPTSPLAHNNLATHLLAKGDDLNAEPHLRQSLAFDARFANSEGRRFTFFNLLTLLRRQGRFDDAIAVAREELQHPRASSVHVVALADLQEAAGDVEAALATYRRYLSIGGDLRLFRHATALMLRSGNMSEANDLAGDLLTQDKDNPEVQFFVGQVAAQSGDFPRAGVLLLGAARVIPAAKQYVVSYAQQLAEKGDGRQANELVARLQAAFPQDPALGELSTALTNRKRRM